MKTPLKTWVLFLLTLSVVGCSDSRQSERIFKHFLNRHVERVKPINKKMNEAVWDAYTGKSSFSELLTETRISDSLYKKLGEPTEYYQNLLNNVYDNSSDFELLIKLKQSGLIADTILKREFVDVFRNYVFTQNNWNETDSRKTELYEKFFELKKYESTYWDSVYQTDSKNARKEWIDRFADLTDDYRNMIVAMNNDARRLGYQNYYQLIMDFNGVDYSSIDEISRIVEQETLNDYKKLLTISRMDIQRRFDIESSAIQLKHYNYTVKQMMVPDEWRKDYTNETCLQIIKDFFALGNYEIDEIIENSDLWYEEGKIHQSFFFCSDPDECNYKIYANVKPNTIGVYTLLHEFAHAVHYKYVDRNIPYLLKDPHEIATEGVAIYFNDKLYHSTTLRNMMGLDSEPKSVYYKAFADPTRLVFLRKLVRNIQFEKSIFEDPHQDFNALWWKLTQKYMLYDVDEDEKLPEWMSNQHLINASGIHVFYLYAFAFSAQLEYYFPDNEIAPLKDGLMTYGDAMEWDDLLEKVTGEKLNLSYLFNSYKWKNKRVEPITFDVKPSNSLSYFEKDVYDMLTMGSWKDFDLKPNTI